MAVNYIDYILHFENVDKSSLPLVGGKNASLGEMIKAGIRVPTGFAVTTKAYLDFVTEAGLTERIMEVLCDVNPNDIKFLDQASSEVQALVNDAMMNVEIERAIEEGYSFLCDRCGAEKLPVAVRSSATAEDLPTASFAGLQDTYLWVQGTEQVIKNVQKCWASLYTSRAISYRIRNGFTHEKVLISVGVQKMVNAKVAGVMFTINPINGDPSKVIIEGNWGLGETVVSGTVNPDRFVVDKVVFEINEMTVSAKHIECVYEPEKGEVVHADVEPEMQCKCCLEDREVKELVRLGKIIEAHYGRPMDIEWAIDKDLSFPQHLFIVQARPETIWSQKGTERKLKVTTGNWGKLITSTLMKPKKPVS